jgi:dTDP-4-dehydrorhamnose 3,5-epimerase-like enzyme
MYKNLKVNFQDERGKIIDIFVSSPKDHCTMVTFNKGAVRGNHFHKKTIQYTFVVEGKLLLVSQRVSSKGKLEGKPQKKIIKENSLVLHRQNHAHAFKALKKSKILAFADGKRGGNNYNSDTYNLNVKLL